MLLRISGLVSFCLAGLWVYRWEVARAFLYERGFHVMGLTEPGPLSDWSVPALLVAVGLYLFWRTGKSKTPTAPSRPSKSIKKGEPGAYCDLRELFGRLAPQLPLTASKKDGHATIGTSHKGWEVIGDEVLKQLSSGQLHAIGAGYKNLTRRLNPAPIPVDFWLTAKFTYWFLDDDGDDILDAKARQNDQEIHYSDIEVNRAEAFGIWPDEPWPAFDKWDKQKDFQLYEAACLWFNIEPRLPMPERAQRKYQEWKSMILGGGMPVHSGDDIRNDIKVAMGNEAAVTPYLRVYREVLIGLAENEPSKPLFLYPYRRGGG